MASSGSAPRYECWATRSISVFNASDYEVSFTTVREDLIEVEEDCALVSFAQDLNDRRRKGENKRAMHRISQFIASHDYRLDPGYRGTLHFPQGCHDLRIRACFRLDPDSRWIDYNNSLLCNVYSDENSQIRVTAVNERIMRCFD